MENEMRMEMDASQENPVDEAICAHCDEVLHADDQVEFTWPTGARMRELRHRWCLPRLFWMNVYRVRREYGGPEEGGWYYDAGILVASVPVAAEAMTDAFWKSERERLETLLGADLGRYERLDVNLEEALGAPFFPEERPHYC